MFGIRVVPEHKRLVVFRLGRPLDKPKGPGIVFPIPVIDHAVQVDLQEQKRETSVQEIITKDFIPVSADLRWHYKVLDPIKAIVSVGKIETFIASILSTRLRKIVLEINSEDLLFEHERIRQEIGTDTGLRDVFEKRGVTTTRFEILKFTPEDSKKINNLKFQIVD